MIGTNMTLMQTEAYLYMTIMQTANTNCWVLLLDSLFLWIHFSQFNLSAIISDTQQFGQLFRHPLHGDVINLALQSNYTKFD